MDDMKKWTPLQRQHNGYDRVGIFTTLVVLLRVYLLCWNQRPLTVRAIWNWKNKTYTIRGLLNHAGSSKHKNDLGDPATHSEPEPPRMNRNRQL